MDRRPQTSACAAPSASFSTSHKSDSNVNLNSAQSTPVTPPRTVNARTSSRRATRMTSQDTITASPRTPDTKKGKQPLRAVGNGDSRVNHQQRRSSLTAFEDKRHSHGLSWSSTTRDSVVDTLLSSFDTFSGGYLPPNGADIPAVTDFDRERFRAPTLSAPFASWVPPIDRPSRPARGHAHTSSLSSEFNPYRTTTTAITYGSPASISTITALSDRPSESGTPRAVIAHNTLGTPIKTPGKSTEQEIVDTDNHIQKILGAAIAEQPSSPLIASPKTLGPPIDTTRSDLDPPAWIVRRSMSMDHLFNEAGGWQNSILDRGRPVRPAFSSYDMVADAAPEPNVAAGPRKLENPSATGPVYVGQAPKITSIRKVTTHSDLRNPSKGKPQVPPVPASIRDQASEFVRASTMRGGMPALSQDHTAPAPSSAGYVSSPREVPSPQRERLGFFKRVFGGSGRFSQTTEKRSSKAPNLDSRTRSITSTSAATPASPVTEPRAKTSDGKYGSNREVTTDAPYPPPSLNKKPSFFRRRKKSTSAATDIPPLPSLTITRDHLPSQPSPGESSLRQVMDSFLNKDFPLGAQKGPLVGDPHTPVSHSDLDDLDIFHSGYTPPVLQGAPPRQTSSAKVLANGASLDFRTKKRPTDGIILDMTNISPPRTESVTDRNQSVGIKIVDRPVSPVTPTLPHDMASDHRRVSPISWNDETGDLNSRSVAPTRSGGADRGYNADAIDVDEFVIRQAFVSTSSDRPGSKRSERLYLQPDNSSVEDKLGLSKAQSSQRKTATTTPRRNDSVKVDEVGDQPLPSVQLDGQDLGRWSLEFSSVLSNSEMPVKDDGSRERAKSIFDGDETHVSGADAAAWLGEKKPMNENTLLAYMQLFDLSGLNLVAALRKLCSKLLLRGETQQFDRIIQALSTRWVECNVNHGFKAVDVVHTIFYSLILLNTDLHLADIGEKMSRSAYVKNTVPTIRRVVTDSTSTASDDASKPHPQNNRPVLPWLDSGFSVPPSDTAANQEGTTDANQSGLSTPAPTPITTKRLSLRPATSRTDSGGVGMDASSDASSSALVNGSWSGTMKAWETEMENVLKSYFNSIKSEPLPLMNLDNTATDKNLVAGNAQNNSLRRSASVISKAPSENPSFRSKQGTFRNMNMWQNRNTRSRQRIYPSSAYGSSRTSFDDDTSLWSPAQSTWSKNSFSKTLTSASMASLPTAGGLTDYKHSIGFANALSQAIIREEGIGVASDAESFAMPGGLLEDEAMALEGAPWAKEGLVKHKHHLETPDRKAKERTWSDCFAVIGKGKLTLFAFNSNSKQNTHNRRSTNKPSGKAASIASTRVGGGDWMENAEQLEVFILRQTIASMLPPPGYSKARPHVWALSLPTGAVHLFHVGTPEIAAEFMTTANYWSARLSKEPLAGGVSNVEYGWSDQVLNMAVLDRPGSVTSPPASIHNVRGHVRSPSSTGGTRPSYQSSLRRSIDSGFGNTRVRLPGDKIQIADWQPPTQSMMASQLLEVDQLRGLTTYVRNMEEELSKHNELKHAIELAYSPRHSNYSRSLHNWQRKSEYLLREIVKFQTYVDSLTSAQKSRDEFYVRKAEMDAKRASFMLASNRSKEERSRAAADATIAA